MKTKILVILLTALGLRLISLDQSLWLDEAIEWWAVKSFGLRELLTGYMAGDFNPPGHHLLMWFWVRVFGDSEVALRMPSVIFGVGTVFWIYKISEIIYKKSDISFLAAGMAAVNGLLIYYSQEARMYAMAAFLVAGAMYFFMRGKKLGNLGYLGYFALMGAAMYSHYLTWLLMPFVVIWGIRYLAPLLLTILWWPMLWKQLQAGMLAAGNPVWASLSQTNFKNLALVAVKFVTGRVPWPEGWWEQALVAGLVLGFWVAVVIGGIRVISPSTRLTLRRRPPASRSQRASVRGSDVTADFLLEKIRSHPKAIWLVILLWAGGPLLLGAVIGLFMPVFTYFRFLFVVPAVMVLMARGVDWPRTNLTSARGLRPRSRRAQVRGSDAPAIFPMGKIGIIRRILGVYLLGVMLIFSLVYLFDSNNHREDWRGAVGELRRQEAAPVVLIHPAVKPPFDYYDKGGSMVIPSTQISDFRFQIPDSFWYLPYAQEIFDPEDTVRKDLSSLGYVKDYEQHFRGVTLERWTNVDSIARRIL